MKLTTCEREAIILFNEAEDAAYLKRRIFITPSVILFLQKEMAALNYIVSKPPPP